MNHMFVHMLQSVDSIFGMFVGGWGSFCCTNASCLTKILNKPLSSSLKKLPPMFALG